ncbi:DUF4190 domain-containing protein [Clostridium gasigenes]|uniref:DUF4190 domain-containing protein n=1 Tax=Clostridium gasigenes TaxID=94869 RepID=UPI001C0B800F|nr:DUF4190 domain-containing protein [Clostridium gasigenes]MBU3134647.1 DUF4190 domain-containing protein [Clostridium gasigenes]
MDIAALILGIVGMLFSFFCGFITMITAPIGLTLGIIDLVKKKKENMTNNGMAISGIILCSLSLVIAVIMFFVLASVFSSLSY